MRRGRPAFSSSHIFCTSLATFSFQGGGLLFACLSWSVTLGFHTPVQSGRLARYAQSCAVGGGLITVGGFFGGCCALAAVNSAQARSKGEINSKRTTSSQAIGRSTRS